MAQRTGIERLLTSPVRTASAGLVPALAVSLLLAASGCGDSPSDERTASAPSPAGTSRATSPPPASSPSGGRGSTEGGDSKQGSDKRGSGKHGRRVAVPEGAPEPGITPEQRTEAIVANIALKSPTLRAAGAATLPEESTCDGENAWPAFEWNGIPEGTAELALFGMSSKPVNGKLFFDWAVAGIDPGVERLASEELPRGAVVGRNSFGHVGYSVCPPAGESELYVFALYALPERLAPQDGFDPRTMREQINQMANPRAGLLVASYTRS